MSIDMSLYKVSYDNPLMNNVNTLVYNPNKPKHIDPLLGKELQLLPFEHSSSHLEFADMHVMFLHSPPWIHVQPYILPLFVRELMSEVYVHRNEQDTTKKAPYLPTSFKDISNPALAAIM